MHTQILARAVSLGICKGYRKFVRGNSPVTSPTEADVDQMTVDDISQMDDRCSTTSGYVDNDTDATCILNDGQDYYDYRSFAEAGCLATLYLNSIDSVFE